VFNIPLSWFFNNLCCYVIEWSSFPADAFLSLDRAAGLQKIRRQLLKPGPRHVVSCSKQTLVFLFSSSINVAKMQAKTGKEKYENGHYLQSQSSDFSDPIS
jgi:hypothetical protein